MLSGQVPHGRLVAVVATVAGVGGRDKRSLQRGAGVLGELDKRAPL
jgi:hypothetical protein